MKKHRLIPFRLMPGSWGLTGQPYREAEAAYHLDGEDLDRRLVELRVAEPAERAVRLLGVALKHGRLDPYGHDRAVVELEHPEGTARALALLDVERAHGRIEGYEHDRRRAELAHPDGVERELALLEVEHAHGRIAKGACDKQRATLKDEPWIGFIDHGFDLSQGVNGVYFEFDWNPQWIDYLRLNGYGGSDDEQIVERWFADVCRSHAELAQPEPAGQMADGRTMDGRTTDGRTADGRTVVPLHGRMAGRQSREDHPAAGHRGAPS